MSNFSFSFSVALAATYLLFFAIGCATKLLVKVARLVAGIADSTSSGNGSQNEQNGALTAIQAHLQKLRFEYLGAKAKYGFLYYFTRIAVGLGLVLAPLCVAWSGRLAGFISASVLLTAALDRTLQVRQRFQCAMMAVAAINKLDGADVQEKTIKERLDKIHDAYTKCVIQTFSDPEMPSKSSFALRLTGRRISANRRMVQQDELPLAARTTNDQHRIYHQQRNGTAFRDDVGFGEEAADFSAGKAVVWISR